MATSNAIDARQSTEHVGDGDRKLGGTSVREATVTIRDANLAAIGIADLITLVRRAGLQSFAVLAADRHGAVVQVELEDRLPESRLKASETVGRWEHVATTPGRERYVLEVTAPAFPASLAEHEEDLFGTLDATVTDHGLTISFVGRQHAIAAVLEEYERLGLAPDLRRLGEYDGTARPLDVLTERQREVVTTAYDLGYYEVPREATTDDVAAELDVDASTVTEHLQRAERNLLGRHLSN